MHQNIPINPSRLILILLLQDYKQQLFYSIQPDNG
jgi:hypothetical protein